MSYVYLLENQDDKSWYIGFTSDWERQRIEYHYEIGINTPSFGKIIDNTNQTSKETTKIILQEIMTKKVA